MTNKILRPSEKLEALRSQIKKEWFHRLENEQELIAMIGQINLIGTILDEMQYEIQLIKSKELLTY